ncbi:MAG: hypothetical protein AB7P24_03015 [Nitrospira sp.]
MNKGFRRLNFFTGFATSAQDWQELVAYHAEKRRLHNQYFHSPGLIKDCLQGLDVTPTKNGTALCVKAGMALDGEGRELYLPEAVELNVSVSEFRGRDLYVAISYKEQLTDFRPNPFSADHSGHAFIEEKPEVTIIKEQPDNMLRLELARVDVSSDATALKDAKDPATPKKNEIDRRFIRRTGRARLEDLAEYVVGGKATVAGNSDTVISIREHALGEHHYYIASVSMSELENDRKLLKQVANNQGISWEVLAQCVRDESTQTDRIAYKLRIANSTSLSMTVAYRVCSLC